MIELIINHFVLQKWYNNLVVEWWILELYEIWVWWCDAHISILWYNIFLQKWYNNYWLMNTRTLWNKSLMYTWLDIDYILLFNINSIFVNFFGDGNEKIELNFEVHIKYWLFLVFITVWCSLLIGFSLKDLSLSANYWKPLPRTSPCMALQFWFNLISKLSIVWRKRNPPVLCEIQNFIYDLSDCPIFVK